MLIRIDPQSADVQDRDKAVLVLCLSRRTFPFIAKAFADAGSAGERPATATIIAVEIVRKPQGQVGFAVHPRRLRGLLTAVPAGIGSSVC